MSSSVLTMMLSIAAFPPTAASATAQSVEALAPSGSWTVDYRPRQCVLSRPFGTGAARRIFALASEATRERVNLVVTEAVADGRGGGSDSFDVRVAVDGGVPSDALRAQSDTLPNAGQRVTRIPLPDATSKAVASARRILVSGRPFTAAFAPSGMAKAYAAFDRCARDLAEKTGVDLALRDAVVTKAEPAGDIGALFGFDNYPPGARQRGDSGRARVLLTIEPVGGVSACKVIETSFSVELDAKTCTLFLGKSRWRPARDRDGKPVRSQQMTAVEWRLGF